MQVVRAEASRALAATAIRRPSRRLLALFVAYLRWYVPRAFHAVRVAHAERFPRPGSCRRLVVCINHPSWWDPLFSMLLSRYLALPLDHYAPMEASALGRYGFMRRLGLFPLDTASARSGAHFLRDATALLERPLTALWITPEGGFTDVRQRPVVWRPGVAALIARQTECVVVPLALEYTFWNERLPEALALVGEPLLVADGRSASAAEWQQRLTARMTQTQDALAALAMARDPAPFATVLRGGSGVAPAYNAWKRIQARLRHQRYSPEHGDGRSA